jgi:hypothetical protein
MPPKTIDALGTGPSEEFVRSKEIREKLASLEKYRGPITTEIPKFKPVLENIDILFGKMPKPKTIATYEEPPQVYRRNVFMDYILTNVSLEEIKKVLLLKAIIANIIIKSALTTLLSTTKDKLDIQDNLRKYYKS